MITVSPRHTTSDRRLAGVRRELGRREVLGATAGVAGLAALGRPVAAGQAKPAGPLHAPGTIDQVGSKPAVRTRAVAVQGEARTPPVAAGDCVLLGTDRGVFAIENGSLEFVVETGPVRHIEVLSPSMAVVLLETTTFDNVLVVDPTSGENRWITGSTREVYNSDRGHEERVAGGFGVAALDDGATPDVVVAGAYGIAARDGDDGSERWSVEYPFYVWDVTVIDGTVYAGTQDGQVLALDASTGEETFAVTCVEPFDGTPRSVWSVAPTAGGDGVLATGEDGRVRRLDLADGSTVWETEAVELADDELQQYYRRLDGRPTMPGPSDEPADEHYRNLELVTVFDDGSCLVHARGDQAGGPAGDHELMRLDADGEVTWQSDHEGLEQSANVVYAPDVDPDAVFLPQVPQDGTQRIERLDLADGGPLEAVEVDTISAQGPRPDGQQRGYGGAVDGSLVIAPTDGAVLGIDADGTISWTTPRFSGAGVLEGPFSHSESTDYLVMNEQPLGRREMDDVIDAMVLRSGADGEPVWSHAIDHDTIETDGLYQQPAVLNRGDGGVDLAVIQAPPADEDQAQIRGHLQSIQNIERQIEDFEDEIERLEEEEDDRDDQIDDLKDEIDSLEAERESLLDEIDDLGGLVTPQVLRIDGQDGAVVAQVELLRETDMPVAVNSFATFADEQLGLVGGEEVVQLIDLDAGEILLEREYQTDDFWPPIDGHGGSVEYQTVAGSGPIEDLIAVYEQGPTVSYVETSVDGDDIVFEAVDELELDGNRTYPAVQPETVDITGDGRDEVVVAVQAEDEQSIQVIQTDPLQVLTTLTGMAMLSPAYEPITDPGSGEPGLLVYQAADEETMEVAWLEGGDVRFREEIRIDGRIGGQRQSLTPAAPLADPTGEGQTELAIATTAPDGDGLQVVRYDVDTGQETDRVELVAFDRTDPQEDVQVPAFSVHRVTHPVDDRELVGIVADPGLAGRAGFHLADPTNGERLASGAVPGGRFASLADGSAGVLGSDGTFARVQLDPAFELEADTDDDALELSWTYPDENPRATRVYVNDRLSVVTGDTEASIGMPAGDHDVRIEAVDRLGAAVHAETETPVDGGSVMDLVLYGLATVSVGAVFTIGLADAIRRRVRS